MVLWLNVWNKELLTLKNFFVVTKKFLKAKFDCNNHLIWFCKQAQKSSSSWKFQYDLGLVLQVLPIVTPLVFGISLSLVLPQQMHVADHLAYSLPNGLANYSCTYCFHRKQNVKSCTTKVNSKYIAFNMVYVPKRGCRVVVNSCY